jgi:DNA primase large subunit
MNVVPSASDLVKRSKQLKEAASSSSSPSSISINFYQRNPQFELTLDDFEVFALKRLKILRKIEQLRTMGRKADEIGKYVDKLIKEQDLNDETIDEASHFILRLSYCQNEELRRWYLQHESALFEYRLKSLSGAALAASVRDHCQLTPLSAAEFDTVKDQLASIVAPGELHHTKCYAVPFTQVLDLVGRRQCYLRNGRAYLPQSKLLSILVHKFRAHLSHSLTVMGSSPSASLRYGTDDPEHARLHPLLHNMSRVLVHTEDEMTSGGSSSAIEGGLTAANVVQYKANMPLCMMQLQRGLEDDKKLKHFGRLQYGLFLKGAGLSMDDSLAFFQRHFTTVTGEQFQKEYSYNIRHMYGKEGKRANYTPYSCTRIILGNAPSSGHHHGCPYKHYDVDHLESLLRKLQVGDAATRAEIVNLKKAGQFQLACLKHFHVRHPEPNGNSNSNLDLLDNVGNHPNAWFKASVAYQQQQQPTAAAGGAAASVVGTTNHNNNNNNVVVSP